jgi:hypothetical protein
MDNDDLLENQDDAKRDLEKAAFNAAQMRTIEAEKQTPPIPPDVIMPSSILPLAMQKIRLVIGLTGLFYTALTAICLIGAVAILAPDLIYMLDRSSPILMVIAQIAIALLAFATGIGALAVIYYQPRITNILVQAEAEIDDTRDIALIQLQSTRFTIEELTTKLKHPSVTVDLNPMDYLQAAKSLAPLLSLINAKERNLMELGKAGYKAFRAIKRIMR